MAIARSSAPRGGLACHSAFNEAPVDFVDLVCRVGHLFCGKLIPPPALCAIAQPLLPVQAAQTGGLLVQCVNCLCDRSRIEIGCDDLKVDATNSFAPFAHFGYRLASGKAAEFGKEAPDRRSASRRARAIPFVPKKTVEQQDIQALHRARQRGGREGTLFVRNNPAIRGLVGWRAYMCAPARARRTYASRPLGAGPFLPVGVSVF